MKNQTLDKIYQKHHTERRRGGFAVLEKERGELFAKLIGKNKRILDLGCRDGVITKYFSLGNEVLGVDVDSEILKIAHDNLGIEIINLDIQQEWPFEEGEFDVVVAGEVLEHVYFPEEVIKKIVRILKPGGVFVGSVPNAFSLKNRLRYLLGRKKGTPLKDPLHINHFSFGELDNLLGEYFINVKFYPLGNKHFGLAKIFPSWFAYALAFSGELKNINRRLGSVSFFCPAYNDQGNLPELIPKVHKFLTEVSNNFEIIIIEDGSPDKTDEVADELAVKYLNVHVIHHKQNTGYGGALKDGFRNAKYEYVMYTDGDNQYDVNEFRPYLNLLDKADVISGYATVKAVNFRRKIQSEVFNWLILIIFGYYFKDVNCSMKVYKRKVLDSMVIKSDSAFIDAEMMVKAKRKGFAITQFPVTHYPRKSGPEGGSKWTVIWTTIKDMIRFRFGIL